VKTIRPSAFLAILWQTSRRSTADDHAPRRNEVIVPSRHTRSHTRVAPSPAPPGAPHAEQHSVVEGLIPPAYTVGPIAPAVPVG
jgi:hypothetical protein